jgi:hypothetical protein
MLIVSAHSACCSISEKLLLECKTNTAGIYTFSSTVHATFDAFQDLPDWECSATGATKGLDSGLDLEQRVDALDAFQDLPD